MILSLSISCLESKPKFIRHHRYLHRFVLKLKAWFCVFGSISVVVYALQGSNAVPPNNMTPCGDAQLLWYSLVFCRVWVSCQEPSSGLKVTQYFCRPLINPPPHVTNPVCVWSMKKSRFPSRSGSGGRLQMWLPSKFSSSTDLFFSSEAAVPPVTITTSE